MLTSCKGPSYLTDNLASDLTVNTHLGKINCNFNCRPEKDVKVFREMQKKWTMKGNNRKDFFIFSYNWVENFKRGRDKEREREGGEIKRDRKR